MKASSGRDSESSDFPPEEIARRRDETIKRMIAIPPTTLKGVVKTRSGKAPKAKPKP